MKYNNLVTIDEFFLKNKVVLLHIDSDSLAINKFDKKFNVIDSILHLLDNNVKLIILSTAKRYQTYKEYLEHKTNSKAFYDELVEKIGMNRTVAQYTEVTKNEQLSKIIDGLPPKSLFFLDNAFTHDYVDDKIVNYESNYTDDLGLYWANLCDLYIDDNFAQAYHRISSNYGIEKFKSDASGVGYLIKNEIKNILNLKKKITSKSLLILSGLINEQNLETTLNSLSYFDNVILLGELSYLFLNIKFGTNFKINCNDDLLQFANKIYKKYNKKINLPSDYLCVEKNITNDNPKSIDITNSNINNSLILDIGNKSVNEFKNIIKNSNSIVFCNLSSDFYNEQLSIESTKELLEEIRFATQSNKISIICSDDTCNKIISEKYWNDDSFTYLSSGNISTLSLILDMPLLGLEGVSRKNNFLKKLFK
ncbi:MAG: phosphoglycerate kinase [Ureaplasma sp.]|nr:phosphoglycerate kinase [Ureaplasma sp.]